MLFLAALEACILVMGNLCGGFLQYFQPYINSDSKTDVSFLWFESINVYISYLTQYNAKKKKKIGI